MITKEELMKWLASVPDGAEVGIDEGGLLLEVVGTGRYLEVGGLPDTREEVLLRRARQEGLL